MIDVLIEYEITIKNGTKPKNEYESEKISILQTL